MAKKQTQAWLDEQGELNTWDDLVDEVKLQYRINAALHRMLTKLKVSVKDVANATYQAKSEYYGWKKETGYKPKIVDNKAKDAKVKKKTKKNSKKN